MTKRRNVSSTNSYYEKVGGDEPVCIDDELLFELPDGWEWARLITVCSYLHRGKSPKYIESSPYPVFAQKCNQPTGITLEKARFLNPISLSRYDQEEFILDGDIVVNSTGTGTLGRVGLFSDEDLGDYPFIVADSHVMLVRVLAEGLNVFAYLALKSEYGQSYIFANQTGSTNQKELPTKMMEQLLLPVPPQRELLSIISVVNRFSLVINLE